MTAWFTHITTQPALILSFRSYPVLFIILSSGLCLPKVRVSLPRQTDRLQGRVSEEWRHKERGESDLIWATVGRGKERKEESLKERKRVGVPLYTVGHRFFFFLIQTPLTPADDSDRLIGRLWRSDELRPCPRTRGHSCFKKQIRENWNSC